MVPELIQPAVEIVNAANEREQTRDINCDEIKWNLSISQAMASICKAVAVFPVQLGFTSKC